MFQGFTDMRMHVLMTDVFMIVRICSEGLNVYIHRIFLSRCNRHLMVLFS